MSKTKTQSNADALNLSKEKGVPDGWREIRFSDFCNITRGGSPRPIHDYIQSTGIPWVKIADATSSESRYIFSTKEFIKPEGETKSRIVFPGDLIVSNSATPGLPRFMKIRACIHDGWLLLRDIKNVDKVFLYYLILKEREAILIKGSGTIFTNLKTDILKKHKVILPPLPEQKAIAEVLSSLDDKIDLLHRQNKTLEDMAQALFRKWFVDNTERENWEKKKIGEVLETKLGGTPSTSRPEYWNGDVPWINSGEINKFRIFEPTKYITKLGFEKSATKLLPKGSTVIAITGATLGQVSLLEIDTCANQSVVGIIPNDNFSREFVYLWIKKIIGELIANQTGGAQQHINKNDINNSLIIVPPKELLVKKGFVFKDIFNKISKNVFQIRTLEKLRDTLLPKLMNGTVRVKI